MTARSVHFGTSAIFVSLILAPPAPDQLAPIGAFLQESAPRDVPAICALVVDRDKVLFHPGAERDSRTLREDELFEPGRSALTAGGRQRLAGHEHGSVTYAARAV